MLLLKILKFITTVFQVRYIYYLCNYQILYIWWLIVYNFTIKYNLYLSKSLLFILLIVLSSTYLSLLERHIVAIVQQRVGPTNTGLGLLQPLADAFKLLTKEPIRPYKSYTFLFRTAPIYTFTVAITIWAVLPLSSEFIISKNIQYTVILILALLTFNNYGIILGAWASQNKYALLSGYRTIALTSSYGISLSLIFWYPVFLARSLNLMDIVAMQELTVWFIVPGLPLSLLFWIILLTEVKKIPFDVTESEAELGSGYLIEYSGMGFALYIISEYSYIFVFTILFTICFLGGWLPPITVSNDVNCEYLISTLSFIIKILVCILSYLLLRSSLPNYRFDFIMSLHWRCLFPSTLIIISLSVFTLLLL